MLFFAYLAVLLSLGSGILALFTNQRLPLLDMTQRLPDSLKQRLGFMNDNQQFRNILQLSVFVLLGVASLFAIIAGLGCLIGKHVYIDQIHLGLPWLPWHVRFDSLSALFFLIVGIATFAVSLYGTGYVKHYQEKDHPFAVLGLFSGLFIAGMLLVLLADDAFFFYDCVGADVGRQLFSGRIST